MAALKKPYRSASSHQARLVPANAAAPSKIYEFAQRIYEKTGGPTEDLRRVHAAYLANQKKA